MRKLILFLAILWQSLAWCKVLPVCAPGREITVNPDKAVIVLPVKPTLIEKTAAEELQTHFRLITGKTVPVQNKAVSGSYAFIIGKPSGLDVSGLIREEARWEAGPESARFYGEDFQTYHHVRGHWEGPTRCGTMTAVYEFLEKQFGILWLKPGDRGVYCHPSPVLRFRTGRGRWIPGQLKKRWLGGYPWRNNRYFKTVDRFKRVPKELFFSDAEYDKIIHDMDIWKRRMRMGDSLNASRNYTEYYLPERFKDSHPEYLALDETGQRRMYPGRPEFTKICISNPDVLDVVVNDWKNTSPRPDFITLCPSDGFGYCRCPECRKLDVFPPNGPFFPKKGEGFNINIPLTDRHVWFANQFLKKAEKINPNILVYLFAYSNYRFAPLREKVDPRMVIAFVTDILNQEKSLALVDQWRKAGMKHLYYRPNDLWMNIGMPLGFERHLFDMFQTMVARGIIGTSHDSLSLQWPMTGITDYILARGNYDPTRSFEHWEKEYCSIYEEAAPEIMQYYRYWRNVVWEGRIMPSYRAGNFTHGAVRRHLIAALGSYYNAGDFDKTDAILDQALKRKLSAVTRGRVEQLKLANQHARLTYMALAGSPDRLKAGRELLAFRIKYKKNLDMNLISCASTEGHASNMDLASAFSMYGEAVPLRISWQFRPDPENVGEKEQWYKLTPGQAFKSGQWTTAFVTQRWNHQTHPNMPQELKKKLKSYTGRAYYLTDFKVKPGWKGRDISLFFGGVDESAWIWLNGKPVGKRLDPHLKEWANPFFINITKHIDWTRPTQTVTVEVLKTKGVTGGIYRQVFLVSGE